MNFLISKKKKRGQPLFLGIFILMAIFLFILIPKSVSANNFSVVTQLPARLDEKMSKLNGLVSNNENEGAYVWFEYGKKGRLQKKSISQQIRGTQDFIINVYDLEPGIVYSYRAVGRKKDSNVVKYGKTKTFIIESSDGENSSTSNNSSSQQTDDCSDQTSEVFAIPTASSVGKVETTNTTVTLYGVVLTGGASTRGWFEWGTTTSLGRVTPAKKLGSSPRVEMKETITGLSSGTTYYYRTVAVTSTGVSRSAIASFTTEGKKEDSDIGKENAASSLGFKSIFKKETDETINDGESENKVNNEKQDFNNDSLGGVFAWSSSLRNQFFNIDEKGNIDAKISFNEPKEKQNFLLAGVVYGKNFLPNTWSEWGFVIIFLYLIISRAHYFLRNRKKRKEEKKEREEELRRVQDLQFKQTTNNSGLVV